jgi:8-oxo-dGTP pyrophosphatase MutT (NUDIX family)
VAHTHNKLCLTVVIFLTCKEKVLLANHPAYNTWLPIGGHIEHGEDTDEALYREIKEETRLETSDVKIWSDKPDFSDTTSNKRLSLHAPIFVDRHNTGDRDHVAFVYFGEMIDGCKPLKSDEHKELAWFTKKELKDNKHGFKPDIVWYALEALKISA